MNESNLLLGQRVTIVGAGLVGALTACTLAKHGATVTLIEKRADMRRTDEPGGRTIAMSLSHRGWRALENIGLDSVIRAGTKPKHSRCVHLENGIRTVQRYGAEDHSLWTVNRKTLNCALLDQAEASGRVRIRFETRCRSIDTEQRRITLATASGEVFEDPFDFLIAADGMNSGVRSALSREDRIKDEITTLDYRYFELTLPAAADGQYALPSDCVHVWPRPEGLMVALPNLGGTFTGTFFYARGDQDYFGGDITDAERSRRFRAAFPEIVELVPDFENELASNPASDIRAVRCWPWQVSERVLLVGDACHAIVPFFAMGMNIGFEDASELEALIVAEHGNLESAFSRFPGLRRPNTDAIGDLSLRNFTSIGRSADPDFHRRWSLERTLWQLFPERWTPLYPLIHFGHRPLAEVVRIQKSQAEVLQKVMAEYPAEADGERRRLAEFVEPLLALAE